VSGSFMTLTDVSPPTVGSISTSAVTTDVLPDRREEEPL